MSVGWGWVGGCTGVPVSLTVVLVKGGRILVSLREICLTCYAGPYSLKDRTYTCGVLIHEEEIIPPSPRSNWYRRYECVRVDTYTWV